MSNATPIKFGPEWLRNLGEGTNQGGNSRLNNQNGPRSSEASGTGRGRVMSRSISTRASSRNASSGTPSSSSAIPAVTTGSSSLWPNSSHRVHLANLRYGREEMLALYDRSVSPPEKLKHFDTLYQQRQKPPNALSLFKDGQNTLGEGASGAQIGGTSVTGYPGRGRGNGGALYPKKPSNRTNIAAMSRRQIRSTNWRQSGREEGDEWRSQEHGVRFPTTEREWTDRSRPDRSQTWSATRRPWPEQQADEIPEWANDNADAGAGTFDASGAFHGSSEETRPQDTLFPSTRPSTVPLSNLKSDEGTAQWWASEKSIKLSTSQRLTSAVSQTSTTKEAARSFSVFDSLALNKSDDEILSDQVAKTEFKEKVGNADKNQYPESKQLDTIISSASSSSIQSVMLPQNNTLRQQHQNIVASTSATPIPSTTHPFFSIREKYLTQNRLKTEAEQQINQMQGDNLVDQMAELNLNDTNIPSRNVTSNVKPVVTSVLQAIPQGGTVNLNSHIGTNIAFQSHGVANNAPNSIQLQNSASGTSLNLQTNHMMMPIHTVMPQMMPNNIGNPGMNIPSMQHSNAMGAYPKNSRGRGSSTPFLAQNNNVQLPLNNNRQQSNAELTAGMFPMHGIQGHGAQIPKFNSVFVNPPVPPRLATQTSLADLWYYEDPEKKIQGPFSTKEMYSWYKAGYFNLNMLVRRAFETTMRRLVEYGPTPFSDLEASHVWSQPSTSQKVVWLEPMTYQDASVNNLPVYFWDLEPSVIPTKTITPEEIMKGMKTEDDILAEILGPQNVPVTRNSLPEGPMTSVPMSNVNINSYEVFAKVPLVPDLSQLSLLKPEMIPRYSPPAVTQPTKEEPKITVSKTEVPVEISDIVSAKLSQPTIKVENKIEKISKSETDKNKNKDSNGTGKTKTKKSKDEKKEETAIVKAADEDATKSLARRSAESSPSKASKDVKILSKKDIEKEKKELMKDGFTIVKGPEKNNNKEIKKKAEEAKVAEVAKAAEDAKAAEEAARIRKEEEDVTIEVEESRKMLLAAVIKKQVEQQQQKQANDSVPKKAPWSAVARQATATSKDGLTLAEIQKLEREKKLEQIKEQQHMMHIIAQQQAATLAREQEVQAGLGWAKKINTNASTTSLNIGEIQTKAKRQLPVSTVTSESSVQKTQAASSISNQPWGHGSNGGFWDTPSQPIKSDVKNEPNKLSKSVEPAKNKIKPMILATAAKKKLTPAMEFDAWCTQALNLWSSQIDVPTFMGFLKDIESPYEVKDYVKCYLGESRDSSEFSRQFLERRSKLLRVGTVTPSDDLCSPAIAILPRNNSTSDYQEVKGKGRKTKKNKMMRVDARILGFSVTASEDRINVGDIDTA